MAISDFIAPPLRVSISDGIETVYLDVSVEEQHTGDNDVTSFPVEEGPNISDNSRPKPREFSIHGFVTSAPLSLDAYSTIPALKVFRGKKVWEKLDRWRRNGTRLRVITSFFTYVDVVLKTVPVLRNVNNSDGIEVNLQFLQVFTAATKLVSKPSRLTKQSKSTLGKKITGIPDPGVESNGQGLLEAGVNFTLSAQ